LTDVKKAWQAISEFNQTRPLLTAVGTATILDPVLTPGGKTDREATRPLRLKLLDRQRSPLSSRMDDSNGI